MTSFAAVIPARWASTRLPGKPLADIGGRPMVVRVAERARESGADEVIVATDDARIADAVRTHGFDAVLTRADHATGTDRIAEVAAARGWPGERIVVNVQGDEPLIDPTLVAQVARALAEHADCAIATACHPIASAADLANPAVVKVVLDREGRALYFSRAPMPWARDAFVGGIPATLPDGYTALRHVGLYAYRASFLAAYASLAPAPLEQAESLEQLRALWHGYRIHVSTTERAPAPGVDTDADLARVRALAAEA